MREASSTAYPRPALHLPTWGPALHVPGRIVAAVLAFELLLMVLHLTVGLGLGVDGVRLDREQNLPTWFSSTLFAAAGFSSLACALLGRRGRLLWLGFALLMLALSLDEFAALHERAGGSIGSQASELVLQPLAGLVVIGFFLVAARRLGRPLAGPLIAAAAFLVVGQGAATLAPALGTEGAVHTLLIATEELFEMLVPTAVLGAACLALVSPVSTATVRAPGRPASSESQPSPPRIHRPGGLRPLDPSVSSPVTSGPPPGPPPTASAPAPPA